MCVMIVCSNLQRRSREAVQHAHAQRFPDTRCQGKEQVIELGSMSRLRQVLSPAPCAQALAEVHARGLCHLDIKPANVWVAGGGGAPRVCLLDLAFAHEFVPGWHCPHCAQGLGFRVARRVCACWTWRSPTSLCQVASARTVLAGPSVKLVFCA